MNLACIVLLSLFEDSFSGFLIDSITLVVLLLVLAIDDLSVSILSAILFENKKLNKKDSLKFSMECEARHATFQYSQNVSL